MPFLARLLYPRKGEVRNEPEEERYPVEVNCKTGLIYGAFVVNHDDPLVLVLSTNSNSTGTLYYQPRILSSYLRLPAPSPRRNAAATNNTP